VNNRRRVSYQNRQRISATRFATQIAVPPHFIRCSFVPPCRLESEKAPDYQALVDTKQNLLERPRQNLETGALAN